ncbi:MAG: DUF5103 domain-containing protein [Chlorobi bacterium]|nr:DUF5103 domain-containing protein [Chlorobiota bacterium]
MANCLNIKKDKPTLNTSFLLMIFYLIIFQGGIYTFSQTPDLYFQKSSIKTVQLHKQGWDMSYPLIQLGGNDKLVLSFDDLGEETKNYNYTIVHYDYNWQPSDLLETEYMTGYSQNPLTDYQFSFNTKFIYTHYQLVFPNNDFQILKSGNYVIKIFEDNNSDDPVLVRPFMVFEPLVSVIPRIKYSANSSVAKGIQEVDFKILHPHFNIDNAIEEVKVRIMKNGRLDAQINDLKPLFIRPGELVYDYNRENVFEGGNEYRWLDIRSVRFAPEYVKNIVYHDPYYHFELFPDRPRAKSTYFYKEDFNGRYHIEVKEYNNPDIEADYVYVHFSLLALNPYPEGDVYVLGGLSNWLLNKNNRMVYNPQTYRYELTLLLKQGFYNYQYLYLKNGETRGKLKEIEGSFSQTENDYLILVYYKKTGGYYDHLIGVSIANSLKPN